MASMYDMRRPVCLSAQVVECVETMVSETETTHGLCYIVL